jgi:hypothetical protein
MKTIKEKLVIGMKVDTSSTTVIVMEVGALKSFTGEFRIPVIAF